MTDLTVERGMEILKAISNGVTAHAYQHHVSELLLWMLVKEEAERQIQKLDTNYE